MWKIKSCFLQAARFFQGRRVWKQMKVAQIPMTKADLFLRIFEAISGTLKRFETLQNAETLLKPLKNGPNTLWKPALKMSRGKNILLVCVHYPHAGECATALLVIIFFTKMLFCRVIRFWFTYSSGKVKVTRHVKLLSLVAKISDICECEHEE